MVDNIVLGFACTIALTTLLVVIAVGRVEYLEWRDKKSYRK